MKIEISHMTAAQWLDLAKIIKGHHDLIQNISIGKAPHIEQPDFKVHYGEIEIDFVIQHTDVYALAGKIIKLLEKHGIS